MAKKKKGPLKAYEAMRAAAKADAELERPHKVTKCAGLEMRLFGEQLAIGEDSDFMDLSEAREVAEYLADQLGGSVTWG